MLDNVLSEYGAKVADKLVVVPNRVDLTKFNVVKSNYDVGTKLKIITVGRFSPLKNHINLINDLFSSGIEFCLTVVGGGDLKQDYCKLFEYYKKTDDLIVYENITHEELAAILPCCDIYVHYSLSEGVPRAILEAMSCGLPVITTNVGYLKGVVVNGVNGIIIEQPYKYGLHSELRKLSSSVSCRKKIGTNARQYIEANNEWNYVFSLYRKTVFGCD